MILEATCVTCSETFNPHSTSSDDLQHLQRTDGTECGGQGELQGAWLHPGDVPGAKS